MIDKESSSESESDSSDSSDDDEIMMMMQKLQLDNNTNSQQTIGRVLDQLQNLNSKNPADMSNVLQQLHLLNPSNTLLTQQAANYGLSTDMYGQTLLDPRHSNLMDPMDPRGPRYQDYNTRDYYRSPRSGTLRRLPAQNRTTRSLSTQDVYITFSVKHIYGTRSVLDELNTQQRSQLLRYIDAFYTYLKQRYIVNTVTHKADIYNNSIRLDVNMESNQKSNIKPLFQDFLRMNKFPFRDYKVDVTSVV